MVCYFVDQTSALATNEGVIPLLIPSEEYRYLGIMLGVGRAKIRDSLGDDIFQGLKNITRAPS